MAFQKETAVIIGRTFGTSGGSPGFMNAFKAWITKNTASGGPTWFIIDDQSALANNPYIVISNVSTLSNANRNMIIQVRIPNNPNVSDRVYFTFWMWWDTTAHVGAGRVHEYGIITQDSEFVYNFRGNSECLLIMARIGTTWTWVMLAPWVGITTLVLDEAGHTATLAANYPIKSNDGSNQLDFVFNLVGIGPFLDANGKLYATITVTGSLIGIDIYRAATKLSSERIAFVSAAGYTVPIAVNVTQDNGSSVAGTVTFTAKTITDSDIELDFSMTVGAGQGANLAVGEFYYIWDFAAANSMRINYIKVLSITGDKIIVEGASGCAFNSGAIISPYGHRWVMWGSTPGGGNSTSMQSPYMSLFNQNPGTLCISDGYSSNMLWSFIVSNDIVRIFNPNDKGQHGVMKALVHEYRDRGANQYNNSPSGITNTKPNRAYGTIKYFRYTNSQNLSVMADGRTVDSIDYICFSLPGSADAYLFQDTIES